MSSTNRTKRRSRNNETKQSSTSSPNSVLDFHPNPNMSSSSVVHWAQVQPKQEHVNLFATSSTGSFKPFGEESFNDNVWGVYSFPKVGTDEGNNEHEHQEENQASGGDDDDVIDDHKLKLTSDLLQSISAYSQGWDTNYNTFVTLPSPPRQQGTSGFVPILHVTDSMDTEIASNVSMANTPAPRESNSPTSSLYSKRKRSWEESTFEEEPRLKRASGKVRTTVTTIDTPDSHSKTTSSPSPVPQTIHLKPSQQKGKKPIKFFQLLRDMADRLSGLSLDAGSLFSPIEACTAPPGSTLDPHGNDNKSQVAFKQEEKPPSHLLTCTAGCTALDEATTISVSIKTAPTMASYSRSRSLGSTPFEYQANNSDSFEYYDFISCRSDQGQPSAPPPVVVISEAALDEEGGCPSTEIALKTTYPSKNVPQGGVMALSEKRDKDSGDVIVNVAMLSQIPDLTHSTSFDRKRQVVTGARRWSAVVSRQQPQRQEPRRRVRSTTDILAATLEWSSSTARARVKTPGFISSAFDKSGRPLFQSAMSSPSLVVDHPLPKMASPSSAISNNSRIASRRLSRRSRSLADRLRPLPSLADQQEEEDQAPLLSYQEEDPHEAAATMTNTPVTTTASQYHKHIRSSQFRKARY